MYWARAKNILIFTLLALNIFLAINLFMYNSDRGVSAEAEANAEAILRSRNIEIACNIPKTGATANRLNFISDGYDRVKLAEKLLGITGKQASDIGEGAILENGDKKLEILSSGISFVYTNSSSDDVVDMTKISKIEQYATRFLKDNGLLHNSYILDRYITNADKSVTVFFIEKYSGKLIFDNYLKATVTSKGISGIEGSHRSIKKAKAVQDTIMTARQVLLKNFIGSDVKIISGIDMGYKENGNGEPNMKASLEEPVWRIKIKGEDTKFFNVFNGNEIK